MERITALWNRDANGKGAIIAGGMFVLVTLAALVGSMVGGSPAPAHAPAAVATRPSERPAATEPPQPTTAPRDTSTEQPPTATAEPATEEPTDEPEPTGLPTVIKEPTTVIEPPMPPIEPPLPTAPPSQGQGLMSAPQQPAQPAPPARRSGSPQGSACPDDLPVKGNRGKKDWIYHVRGSNNYDSTQPEECFATPADAEAAGYRAPRN